MAQNRQSGSEAFPYCHVRGRALTPMRRCSAAVGRLLRAGVWCGRSPGVPARGSLGVRHRVLLDPHRCSPWPAHGNVRPTLRAGFLRTHIPCHRFLGVSPSVVLHLVVRIFLAMPQASLRRIAVFIAWQAQARITDGKSPPCAAWLARVTRETVREGAFHLLFAAARCLARCRFSTSGEGGISLRARPPSRPILSHSPSGAQRRR